MAMKSQDELKQAAATAAFDYVRERLEERTVIGIGTGSTANRFIDLLAGVRARVSATVASSEASAERLRAHGLPVFDLNTVDGIDVYVYEVGADEQSSVFQEAANAIDSGGYSTQSKISIDDGTVHHMTFSFSPPERHGLVPRR